MDNDIFEQFTEQLRRYIRERLIPAEKEVLETELIPEAIMAEMRDLGLFGLTVPEEYGGAGMNIQQYIRTMREFSYAAPCFRSVTSINIGMVCSAFKNGGTDAQKAHWLPKLASGEILPTAVFTEPNTGSDLGSLRTRAVQGADAAPPVAPQPLAASFPPPLRPLQLGISAGAGSGAGFGPSPSPAPFTPRSLLGQGTMLKPRSKSGASAWPERAAGR